MKISSINIRRIIPDKNLIGFASMIIDDWLYIGNIAIFTMLDNKERIRLVFPQKQLREGVTNLFHPLNSEAYFMLENAVQLKFNLLNKT